jgi:hypothetical protein
VLNGDLQSVLAWLAPELLRIVIVDSLLNYLSDVRNQQTNAVVVDTEDSALSPLIDHVLERLDEVFVLVL